MWKSEIATGGVVPTTALPLEATVVSATGTLTEENFFMRHIELDTAAAGAIINFTAPTPTADSHGKYAILQRTGATHVANIIIPGGVALVAQGGLTSPLPLNTDGDSITLMYVHTPSPTYYVIA